MEENFLHFIWQYQYFRKDGLQTTSGETVNILSTGNHNFMSGPDFSEGRIEIDDLLWTGHVEIHTKASYWDSHNHFKDPAYNNVILHVVWTADKEIYREDGTPPPTIELKDRVEDTLLREYDNLVSNPRDILCFNKLDEVPDIIKISMIERALVDRLERKSAEIIQMLNQNEEDWEETAYQLLARGFGFKSNSEAFYQLSKVLPLKIIYKHADDPLQLEAMLFGQAGFLTGRSKDTYHRKLQKEYEYLKHKHQLPDNMLKTSIWKIGKLRPANFPTVRISQFAAALSDLKNVFSSLLHADSLQKLRTLLRKSPSEYWNNHFLFGEEADRKSATLGLESTDRLVINVVAPLLASYSGSVHNQVYMDQAITTLQQLKPEKNTIVRRWNELNISPSSSADTQGLIELYHSFCLKKSCLSCNIGTSILKEVIV